MANLKLQCFEVLLRTQSGFKTTKQLLIDAIDLYEWVKDCPNDGQPSEVQSREIVNAVDNFNKLCTGKRPQFNEKLKDESESKSSEP